jgi:RNA polymerase sigma factor (sigma-70 family)
MKAGSLPLIGIPEPVATPTTATADLRAALERHHAESMGWAMACCGFDRSEASDVLQDTYLKVLDGRAVFHGDSTFRTWLFGVIRRTAAEQRRSVVRRIARLWRVQREEVDTREAPDPDAAIDGHDIATKLRHALGQLPARQRQVLHLVFQDDLSVEAAAGVMGISVGSARTHYARGKARLRAQLNGEARER